MFTQKMHCHPKSTMENEGLNASTFEGGPLCLHNDCATKNKQEIQKYLNYGVSTNKKSPIH